MAWAWGGLADPKLAGLLNGPMQTLANYLGLAEKTLPVQDVVRTTDGTVTTIHAEIVPVNKTIVCHGFVAARRTGGASGSANDGAGYEVKFVAKNTAGTAALIGAGTVTTLGESVAGWDVTLDASGGTIRVRVTGAATTSVSWSWSGRTLTNKD